jgi:hypothetical protein
MSKKFNREDYLETAYHYVQRSFSNRVYPGNTLVREIPANLSEELPGIIYQRLGDLPDAKGRVSYMKFGELVGIVREQNLIGAWKYFKKNHRRKWLVLGDAFSEPEGNYSKEDLGKLFSSMRANNCNEYVGFIVFERPGAKIEEHIGDYGSKKNKHFDPWVNFFIEDGIDLEKKTARYVKWKNL